MGLLDSTQESTDAALATMATLPLDPVKPEPKHSGWTVVPRFVAAGLSEVGANAVDLINAHEQVSKTMRQEPRDSFNLFESSGEASRRMAINDAKIAEARKKLEQDGIDWRSQEAKPLYDYAESLRPDPVTAGKAEQIVFGVGKGLTKAVGGAVVLGPVGGAAAFGASEGMTASEDLARQGVDLETRTKVGATVGALNTVMAALPVAGNTVAKTIGLAVVGGPGSFIVQQQATRSILENANYDELAQQYDPLDPTGLAISTLFPIGFGAYAMRGARTARAAAPDIVAPKPGEVAPVAHDVAVKATPDEIDAAMVHNLTIARDAVDETPVLARQTNHIEQVKAHPDLAPAAKEKLSAIYEQAASLKPAFDSTLQGIASQVSGKLDAAPLKGVARAVEKITTDYAGDVEQIKDILRATIKVDDAAGAEQAARLVGEQFELKGRPRNLFDPSVEPVDGYRDAKFNVVINGHVAEVQINMPEMLAAKKFAHKFYEERSEIERLVKQEQRDFKPEELKRIDELNASMREIYNPAWEAAQERTSGLSMARNSSFDTGAPLRRIEPGSNTLGGTTSQAALPRPTPGTLPNEAGIPSTSKNSVAIASTSDSSIAQPRAEIKDVSTAYVAAKAEEIKASAPDMPVAVGEDGTIKSAADAIEEVRKLAKEGTDTDLGADDAPLLQVAAECFLSLGQAV